MVPIRCFTCNKVIAHHWEEFCELSKEKTNDEIFKLIGFDSMCCKTMFLTNIDLIDNLLKYSNNPGEKSINCNFNF